MGKRAPTFTPFTKSGPMEFLAVVVFVMVISQIEKARSVWMTSRLRWSVA